MIKMKKTHWTALAFAAVLGSAGVVSAQEPYSGEDADEVAALGKAKLSLIDAINAAERETSGKALQAEIEVKKGGVVLYEVDVFAQGGIKEVQVDPNDGRILKVKQD
jgi:uncharacterized membrane protein YkoI